jgi:hypothetical protein
VTLAEAKVALERLREYIGRAKVRTMRDRADRDRAFKNLEIIEWRVLQPANEPVPIPAPEMPTAPVVSPITLPAKREGTSAYTEQRERFLAVKNRADLIAAVEGGTLNPRLALMWEAQGQRRSTYITYLNGRITDVRKGKP